MLARGQRRCNNDKKSFTGVGSKGGESLGGVWVALEHRDGEEQVLGMSIFHIRPGQLVLSRRAELRGPDKLPSCAHEHVHDGDSGAATRCLVVQIYHSGYMLVFYSGALVCRDSVERKRRRLAGALVGSGGWMKLRPWILNDVAKTRKCFPVKRYSIDHGVEAAKLQDQRARHGSIPACIWIINETG